jgi:VanZ family protein
MIFHLSSISDFGMKTPTKLLPMLAHAFEFGVLTILLIRALRGERYTVRRAVWIAALLALIYAVSDEYHQIFVAEREPSLLDLLIDALAIGAVAAVALTRERRRSW